MQKILQFQSLSWSAIFSGVLAGFGFNFLFNLCMLALGASIFTLTDTKTTEISYIGLVSYIVLSIITMFITGWVAGRLTPPIFIKLWGGLIGFVAWSLLLLVTIIVLTNMIQFTAFHSTFTSHPNLVAIRIANDLPFMTETKEANPQSSPIDVNLEKTTKIITLNATATFLLFLIGSISSIMGGVMGYGRSLKIAKESK